MPVLFCENISVIISPVVSSMWVVRVHYILVNYEKEIISFYCVFDAKEMFKQNIE
jgi:hypothetical protein